MGMEKFLTVTVVDDDAEARQSYKAFLAGRREFRFVGEAVDGRAGVALYLDKRPDVMLMDLHMPVMSGPDAIKAICAHDHDARVIALTTFSGYTDVAEALRAGAVGYVTKDARAEELIEAIHQAVAGEMPLSTEVRQALAQALRADGGAAAKPLSKPLTPRETELLRHLAQGMSNKEIGAVMWLTEASVKQYIQRISEKLDVRSRIRIFIRALQLRIVSVD